MFQETHEPINPDPIISNQRKEKTMPTGYTSNIKDGISFNQFIMSCARAFGALITMKDESYLAKIPKKFKPSDYHAKKIKEAQKQFEKLEKMSTEKATKLSNKASDLEISNNLKEIKEHNDLSQKYNNMLSEVEKWQPPTPGHQDLKNFMKEQIKDSIKWDCCTEYYLRKVKVLSAQEWLTNEKQKSLKDIDYHTKENQKEIAMVGKRNEWVEALRKSL